MRKLHVVHVAMAILYREDRLLHSDDLTQIILGTDLTELGYKSDTPEKTVPSLLTSGDGPTYFLACGGSEFELLDRARVLDKEEVRLALFAISKQRDFEELYRAKTIEFTYLGHLLAAVRNQQAGRSQKPEFQRILVPYSISADEVKAIISG